MSHDSSLSDLAPPAPANVHVSDHFAQFYEEDSFLIAALADFIAEGLHAQGVGIVVASAEHRVLLDAALRARDLDPMALAHDGRYFSLDAAETLCQILKDGWPDEIRFNDVIGRLIVRTSAIGTRPLRVFGEMVAMLWADGKREEAIHLEALWNQLGSRHAFSLFCAYPLSAFQSEGDIRPLVEVCAAHGNVIPTESYAGLATPAERLKVIIQLQQRALAMGGTSVNRQELEEALRRRESELADLLNHISDAVVDVHTDGRVAWGNRAAVGLLTSASSPVGLDLRGGPLESVLRGLWMTLMEGKMAADAQAELPHADGSTRRTQVRATLRRIDKSLGMRLHLRDLDRRPAGPTTTARTTTA